MDEVMIHAYLHQQTLGNKNRNCMTPGTMDNILQELKNNFPDKPISKEKIKDHFNGCYDLFKNGQHGFVLDSKSNLWTTEPDVWDKLIKV